MISLLFMLYSVITYTRKFVSMEGWMDLYCGAAGNTYRIRINVYENSHNINLHKNFFSTLFSPRHRIKQEMFTLQINSVLVSAFTLRARNPKTLAHFWFAILTRTRIKNDLYLTSMFWFSIDFDSWTSLDFLLCNSAVFHPTKICCEK